MAIEEREPLSSDPLISTALTQAKSLDDRSGLLVRLSLYEQRLNRTLEKALSQLKQLQTERVQAEGRALEAAAKIRNLKEALNQPWQPEENGFEFSIAGSPAGCGAASSLKRQKTSITVSSPFPE